MNILVFPFFAILDARASFHSVDDSSDSDDIGPLSETDIMLGGRSKYRCCCLPHLLLELVSNFYSIPIIRTVILHLLKITHGHSSRIGKYIRYDRDSSLE